MSLWLMGTEQWTYLAEMRPTIPVERQLIESLPVMFPDVVLTSRVGNPVYETITLEQALREKSVDINIPRGSPNEAAFINMVLWADPEFRTSGAVDGYFFRQYPWIAPRRFV